MSRIETLRPGGLSCLEARPRLSLLLENETDPLETLQMRRHVDGCERCRRRSRSLVRVMTVLGHGDGPGDAAASPASDIASCVMARLREIKARALAGGTTEMAMKWTGLLLVLTGGLGVWARYAGRGARSLASPLGAFAEAVGGIVDEESIRTIASSMGPALLKLAQGEHVTEMASRAGFDVTLPLQIGLTATTLVFVIALPVSGLLAWMLRDRG